MGEETRNSTAKRMRCSDMGMMRHRVSDSALNTYVHANRRPESTS